MIGGLAVALMMLTPLVPALSADQGDVVLEDGTVLVESIFAKSITIPADARVEYAADIVLSAEESITIEGALKGQRLDAPGDSAFSVTLTAGTGVSIYGSVWAADGLSGEAAYGNATATGTDGGDGGAVYIEWGTLGSLFLADGAFIRSGTGGAGGSASVVAEDNAPEELIAVGGNGGFGGNLTLNGMTAFLHGTIYVGNGGAGGSADVYEPGDIIVRDGGYSNATGGDGVPSGAFTAPEGYSVVDLYQSGTVQGGEGGRGGDASGDSDPITVQSHPSCGANGHWPNHGNGQTGCAGRSLERRGGSGGCSTRALWCLIGGDGADARGSARSGGRGGHGADGQVTSFMPDNPMGGNGGRGGRGGDVTLRGGNGGYGIVRGGGGGDTVGSAGNGGRGGNGGDSGAWYGASSGVTIPSCLSLHPICWMGVSVQPLCGHIGYGGDGGGRGYRYSSVGRPGGSSTGLNNGYGSSSGYSGNNGSGGSNGHYGLWYCDHMNGNHGGHHWKYV